MSQSESYEESHGAAEDISGRLNLVIWGYFLLFGLLLYLIIAGLDVLFRIEVEREQYRKIGAVQSRELIELRQLEEQVLSGEKGLLDGKKHISIDDAAQRFLATVKQNGM